MPHNAPEVELQSVSPPFQTDDDDQLMRRCQHQQKPLRFVVTIVLFLYFFLLKNCVRVQIQELLLAMIEPPSRARLIRRLETASKSTSGAPYYPSGRAKERGEVWEKERVEIELAKLITRRHLWLVILLQIMLHIRNFRRAIFCQLIFLLTFVLYYGSGTSPLFF
jgi:hypothetical protein